ncbi:DUF885 family protein [Polymorphobacter multimanifer]|uniref:DUF885 family protein n=1 Tax=Polymorphobacter multimanifer TaxID=1070431 RepID=UPI001A9CB708|nr:DUF885 family protein [Polymorphobacter multimanifer]
MKPALKALMMAAMLGSTMLAAPATAMAQSATTTTATPAALATLFTEWRSFQASGEKNGAPDFSAAELSRKRAGLKTMQARLAAIDTSGWSPSALVDYNIVRGEMNGLDFDLRVLKPWERDPAWYNSVWAAQSDTPSHEGPTLPRLVELWQYNFPLSSADSAKLAAELAHVPPLLQGARGWLTGNARDLWTSGTGTMADQAETLAKLRNLVGNGVPKRVKAITDAETATTDFVAWLKAETPKKTGPSGVGKENYTWYLRNVQLSDLSWEQEVAILRRELARAHAALRLEEHRNRKLPQLAGVTSPAAYDAQAEASVDKFIGFLGQNDILTVRDYMRPALMKRVDSYVPPDKQNFFAISMHRAPMTLWTHFYHWWDLEMMAADPQPSDIRRGPLLYNLWLSRSEGMATAMEEMMLHAGLFDDDPRAREIVWIMQAQRAARGLASLYMQANMIDMPAAMKMQVTRTPNGWMSPTLPLLASEQQIYLRLPGYGPSYITGKYQIEKLYAERAEAQGKAFSTKAFFDELNSYGMIPVSLIRWQMLGKDDEAEALGMKR